MAVRKYPLASTKHGDGFTPAVLIRCGEPGCTADAHMIATGRTGPAPEFVERFFRRNGWELGRKPSDDRCPDHTKKAKRNAAEHKETADMPTDKTPTAAEKPRQMGRDERRIIHAALQDVYIDDVGYTAGSTDVSVATNLGVPVAWVAEVREQYFGDAVSNPEIDKMMGDMQVALDAQDTLERDLQAVVSAVASLQERVSRHRDVVTQLNAVVTRVTSSLEKKGKR